MKRRPEIVTSGAVFLSAEGHRKITLAAARSEGYAAGYEIGLIAGSERARASCIAALRSLATVLENDGRTFPDKPRRRRKVGP